MQYQKIHNFFKKTIPWLLFTYHCPYCGQPVRKPETPCEDCKRNLPVISSERCKYCGADKSRCTCRKHKRAFEAITAPFYYENTVKKAIHNLKFDGKEFIADKLAKDMAESVISDYRNVEFDCICYVPFTLAQQMNRIYNQSELLAQNLSEELDIPVKNAMIKLFNTKAQHNMTRVERVGNVFGIYDVAEDVNVKGKTILLVDDVKTSGATLDECSWILRIRGAEKVYCVVSAIAGVKPEDEN